MMIVWVLLLIALNGPAVTEPMRAYDNLEECIVEAKRMNDGNEQFLAVCATIGEEIPRSEYGGS
jgi:hypothetical protein